MRRTAIGASESDPKRCPPLNKVRVLAIISFYTFAVYAGSATYIASVDRVAYEYATGIQTALLCLSFYVRGYGVEPLLWAPLSEVFWIGRNFIYTITTFIFFLISIVCAKVTSLSCFVLLRLLQGFFGSPCLANGGASLHDVFDGLHLPLAQTISVAGAYAGPPIGPVMASFLVKQHGWRISMREIVAGSATALMMLLVPPEIYQPKILYQPQKREHRSPRQNHPSDSKKNSMQLPAIFTIQCNGQIGVLATLTGALVKPIRISLQDPAIAFINIYTTYLYSCYYTFFDGFPLIYSGTYHFAPSHIGLTFIPILLGCGIATLLYSIHILRLTPEQNELVPEKRLRPALLAVFAVPIGIFTFGWTTESTNDAHWIWGMLGLVTYAEGVFIILQCIIMYILDSCAQCAASLFAANDFSRSALAVGVVHFGLPLYTRLAPGKACSVLGALSVLGMGGMFVLYWQGAKLRSKSKFTA